MACWSAEVFIGHDESSGGVNSLLVVLFAFILKCLLRVRLRINLNIVKELGKVVGSKLRPLDSNDVSWMFSLRVD